MNGRDSRRCVSVPVLPVPVPVPVVRIRIRIRSPIPKPTPTPPRSWPHRPAASRLVLGLLCLGLCAVAPSTVQAHPVGFGMLDVDATDLASVEVQFRCAGLRDRSIEVRMPPTCTPRGPVQTHISSTGIDRTWTYECTELNSVALLGLPADLQIRGRAARSGGETVAMLDVSQPVLEFGAGPSGLVAFGRLGAEHIAGGFDHLLFVFGLFLLVRKRALVSTITAFTIGHSATLALSVLGHVALPAPPVEACIAFSVLLLAREATRTGSTTLLSQKPAWMALAFGLLHGLGFAGALREVGLPPGEVASSLLGFNLGVEVGQLAFVAALVVGALGVERLFGQAWTARAGDVRRYAAYGVGVPAAYWFVERVIELG